MRYVICVDNSTPWYCHNLLVTYGNLAYGYCLAGMSSDISEAYGKLNVYVGIPGAKNNKGKKCLVYSIKPRKNFILVTLG